MRATVPVGKTMGWRRRVPGWCFLLVLAASSALVAGANAADRGARTVEPDASSAKQLSEKATTVGTSSSGSASATASAADDDGENAGSAKRGIAAAANIFAVKDHNPAGALSGIHVRLPQKVRRLRNSSRKPFGHFFFLG